ncbi:MAG: creatininase family protein [Anaerolineaceae bacterium]|nr:MAG: creatininase family protein [Anaerolineaceae bacterium]
MRLEDLNWMDIETYLKQDDRLMLILGACEQHAYLSLLTDIKIPLALADSASQRTGVLVAPPLNFGFSHYFLDYPGTLSLRVPTLIAAVEDLVRSAYRSGFRRLLILNGHGGNTPVNDHLNDVINDLPGLQILWYQWWDSHSVEAVAVKHSIKPAHANWLEAFQFTIVGDLPEGEKTPPSVPSSIMDAATTRRVYGDGSFGGRYRVEEGIMHEIFNAALEDILLLLKFE